MPPKTKKLSDNINPNLNTVKGILNVSIHRIAAATNKAYSVVCYYFNGIKTPPEDWINTFCSVYCVDKTWLINGTGEPVFTGKPEPTVVSKSSTGAGARVKEVRKKAGLSQKEFGKRIGLTQQGILNIEKDITSLTAFTTTRIENEFDVGGEWLMFGDESKKDFPLSKKLADWLWTKPEVRAKLWEEMERDS